MRRPLGRRGLGGAEAVSTNKRQDEPAWTYWVPGSFFFLLFLRRKLSPFISRM
jgi:hypothetical protein